MGISGEVDKLKSVNGELCAEINRQERRIRELERERDELRERLSQAIGHATDIIALQDLAAVDVDK